MAKAKATKLVIRLGVVYDSKGHHVAFARYMGGARLSDDEIIAEALGVDRSESCPQTCIVEVTVVPSANLIEKVGKVKAVKP